MKRFTRLLVLALAFVLMFSMVACNPPQGPENSDTAVETQTQTPTEGSTSTDTPTEGTTQTQTPTEATTEATTEAITEAGPTAQAIPDGTMIYFEDFSSYTNTTTTDDTLAQLRNNPNSPAVWILDSIETPIFVDSQPYKSNTAIYTIENGVLTIYNHQDAAGNAISGGDSYLEILDDDYMWEVAQGDYTVQYDVKYTSAGNTSRYIAILTNYYGQFYYSFHFRVRGYGNSQQHYAGQWVTHDRYDATTDLYAPGTDTETSGTSIMKRLLGQTYADGMNFIDKEVTIRIQSDYDDGPTIWMKCNDAASTATEFVKVSAADPAAAGFAYWNVYDAGAICLKPGGTINGYVDNIMVWTGLGDVPVDTTVTFQPTVRTAS